MTESQAARAGRELAARHAVGARADTERSLVRFAESPREGEWSLRAALVRFAQPHPLAASAVLHEVRRCDGALASVAKTLLARAVVTDRALAVLPDGALAETSRPLPDARAADLARLASDDEGAFPQRLAAYRAEIDLDEVEVLAVPLLRVALILDALGDTLASWASRGSSDPPIEQVERLTARAGAALDSVGVPSQHGSP